MAANERKAMALLGVKAYRPGQRQLIEAVLKGRDALGILPTGGGKSLCFQLPSLFLPRAVLVVSPLISLMQDQEEKLRARRIASATLNSARSNSDEEQARQDIEEGRPEIVYVTPERLEHPDYLDMLERSGVSMVVVDEAHCVSQWGHDFRPSYLAIRDAVRRLGDPPVLALTATATPEVADDILAQLGIEGALVVNYGIDRPNLIFEVVRTVNEEEKFERLMDLLREPAGGTGIVYVPTVRQADDLHTRLRKAGVAAGRYHGRMKTAERHAMQQGFMENAFRLVVATKAFGLGIDKADVRFVVHYAFPDSLESYVQEAGRAGRDGKPAHAVLFYRLEDRRVQAFFLGGKYPRRDECMLVYQAVNGQEDTNGLSAEALRGRTGMTLKRFKVVTALLSKAGVLDKAGDRYRLKRRFRDDEELTATVETYDRRSELDRERLAVMMKYGQTTECRVRFLTRYFDHEMPKDCGHCDNCRNGVTDLTVDVRRLQAGATVQL
jgi:ATP-dependent DNA helicase RecQ